MSISFSCDLQASRKTLSHSWEHTVGSGHALLGLRSDWQKQLSQCHEELGFRYVRFHGLLSDDVGTFVIEQDKPLYSFFNSDRIVDALLSIGMKPFVELSFMPTALSSGENTVFHYKGNITPPKDYKAWAGLIKKLATHWVDRYGLNEVRQWFFEVWNEPNLEAFWTGSKTDYFKLYQATVHALKEVDPQLRVGGPATAQNEWIEDFVDFCDDKGLDADFISTHYYPTDAFGEEDTDTTSQLADAPHGVMCDQAQLTFRQAAGRPVFFTEWSISSNPRDHFHDEPFAAALATNIIMNVEGLVDGFSYWTFSDIFEENYFPSKPFHGGFGLLNLYGIPKPAFRAYEILHGLGTQTLTVQGEHETVNAWFILGDHNATILFTNHAMPRHPIKTEVAKFRLDNSPAPSRAYVERIDEVHANAKRTWHELGEPEYPTDQEVDLLLDASSLSTRPHQFAYEDHTVDFEVALPPHSVTAVTLETSSP